MSKEITSTVIGKLKQNENFSDWWKSEEVQISFFDGKKLAVTFMDYEPESDVTFIQEADEALSNFLRLSNNDREAISYLACKNCTDFLDAVVNDEANKSLRQLSNHHEIWNFIHPTEIYVARRPYKEQDIYLMIACECDWEQEHGLQFVFRQGKKLTRVSSQDGHLTEADAYAKPDNEDELLSKF